MSPYAVDKRDLQFVLFDYLDILKKLANTRCFAESDRETLEIVMETMIKFASERLYDLNIQMDRQGLQHENRQVKTFPEYQAAYRELCENGLAAPANSAEHGGGGLPYVIHTCLTEIMVTASVAFAMTPGLSGAAAHVIESFGTKALCDTYVEKMNSGVWGGTMCLTESGAGSAVGDLKTRAKKAGDHYLIEGEKIFISSGDHDLTENIIHLVLARIEGEPRGIKGVSLFLVPKFLVNPDGSLGASNNVFCGNIEHKMGIKGSPTCTMVFGQDGPSKGWLIGEANCGIQYMFQMMNEARIGVGVQGLASAGASYQQALQYARDRIQGVDVAFMKDVDAPRVPIIQHPDVRRNLLLMKSATEGMRAMLYTTALFADLALHSNDQDEAQSHGNLLDLLTPICKAYCSDMGFRMTEIGIQVFGGYGYTQEYPVEQYCRDAKIASIYEGTNGIQALDLLGRKVSGKGGLLFMSFLMRINDFINEQENHPTVGLQVKKLAEARDKLSQVVMGFQKAGMEGDLYYPVLNATPFLEMFGHICVSYFLCDMAVLASKKLEALYAEAGAKDEASQKQIIEQNPEARFLDGKIKSAHFFTATYLPVAQGIGDAIMTADRSPLTITFPA